jgi:thymidylate kinase
MLITFSGLDGSGKTTLIEWLRETLESERRAVTVLHLNDQVGIYAWLRVLRDRLLGAPPEAGMPRMEPLSTPLGRLRDAVLWSRTVRRLIYPLDVLIFLCYRGYFELLRRRVLIMDRYFYDRLVDVSAVNGGPWLRWLAQMTPAPDLAVLLEISPEEAFRRKREYTVPYLRRREDAYRAISPWIPRLLRLDARGLEESKPVIARAVRERLRP